MRAYPLVHTHRCNHCSCKPKRMIKIPVVLVVVNVASLVQNVYIRDEFHKFLFTHVVLSFVAFLQALIKVVLRSIVFFLQRAKNERANTHIEYQRKQENSKSPRLSRVLKPQPHFASPQWTSTSMPFRLQRAKLAKAESGNSFYFFSSSGKTAEQRI